MLTESTWRTGHKHKADRPRRPLSSVPSVTLHKTDWRDSLRGHCCPLVFGHEAGFEGKTNCLPWLALLPLDKLVSLVDCLFARGCFFFFSPFFLSYLQTPDQAMTSGCREARGVSDKVGGRVGAWQGEKKKPLSWLLTWCPAGVLRTTSAVFQCQPLA